jgi:hypothetical protein
MTCPEIIGDLIDPRCIRINLKTAGLKIFFVIGIIDRKTTQGSKVILFIGASGKGSNSAGIEAA